MAEQLEAVEKDQESNEGTTTAVDVYFLWSLENANNLAHMNNYIRILYFVICQ
jgi:hypothetical protein